MGDLVGQGRHTYTGMTFDACDLEPKAWTDGLALYSPTVVPSTVKLMVAAGCEKPVGAMWDKLSTEAKQQLITDDTLSVSACTNGRECG